MSLFRKTALDALSSPEQLNQPLQLLRPSQWVLLISLGVFSLTIVIWSIMGRIPVRVSGRGVLIKPNSLALVQSETTGRITQLPAKVGDCLKQGALMGRLAPVSKEVEMKAAQAQLAQMLLQDQGQDGLGAMRVKQLQSQIKRISHLTSTGAISLDELSERQRELSELLH